MINPWTMGEARNVTRMGRNGGKSRRIEVTKKS
jgi:hypothetical protein